MINKQQEARIEMDKLLYEHKELLQNHFKKTNPILENNVEISVGGGVCV